MSSRDLVKRPQLQSRHWQPNVIPLPSVFEGCVEISLIGQVDMKCHAERKHTNIITHHLPPGVRHPVPPHLYCIWRSRQHKATKRRARPTPEACCHSKHLSGFPQAHVQRQQLTKPCDPTLTGNHLFRGGRSGVFRCNGCISSETTPNKGYSWVLGGGGNEQHGLAV